MARRRTAVRSNSVLFSRERGRPRSLHLLSGFTLIELLIVIAIIGILSAIAIVNLLSAFQKARQKATIADMRNVGVMLETYNLNLDHYPVPGVDFNGMEGPGSLKELLRNYVPVASEPSVKDKWGNYYNYVSDGQTYWLESFGQDGKDGPQDISKDTPNEYSNDLVLEDGVFIAIP
mgnify:CR=1 FL=1